MEKVLFFCIFWLQLAVSWDDYNIEHKKTFLAQEGSHVKMEVENRDTKLRIEFPRTPEELITNFYDDTIRDGYKYSRNGSVGIFEIFNLTEKRSGSYEFFFVNETGGGVEYSIEVILAELHCGLNYPMNYIGDTDCQEVEKEKIDGWCHLKISQKPKLHVPIEWRINKKNRDLMTVTYSNESYVEGYEVDLPLSFGDKLNCYASTLQCSISFSPKNITYARNKTSRELTSYKIRPMTSDNKKTIVCLANVSESVHCLYHWKVKDGDFISEFHGEKLLKKDFIKDGTYVCIANCKLKENPASKCRLLADRVDFLAQIKSSESSAAYVILIVLAIVFVPPPFVLSCLFYYRRNREPSSQTEVHNGSLPTYNTWGITFLEKLGNDHRIHQEHSEFIKNFLADFEKIKSLFTNSNLMSDKLDTIQEKIESFFEESANETDKVELKKELENFLQELLVLKNEIEKSSKTPGSIDEESGLLTKENELDKNFDKKLKILSDLEICFKNLYNILGGTPTFSINLEKFLDMDDELFEIWNNLKNTTDPFMQLELFQKRLGDKIISIKQDKNGIQNSTLPDDGSEQIELHLKTDERKTVLDNSFDKLLNNFCSIDIILNNLERSSTIRYNVFTVLNWSNESKNLLEIYERFNNSSFSIDVVKFEDSFGKIQKLNNICLSFKEGFQKDANDTQKFIPFLVEINNQLKFLENILKTFDEELKRKFPNIEEAGFQESTFFNGKYEKGCTSKTQEEDIKKLCEFMQQISMFWKKIRKYSKIPTILYVKQDIDFRMSEYASNVLKAVNENRQASKHIVIDCDIDEQTNLFDSLKIKSKNPSSFEHRLVGKEQNYSRRRLNQDEHQSFLEQRKLEGSLKEMETRLEAHMNEKKKNEETMKQQEQTINDLEQQLEQKEHAIQMFENLSTTQKDVTNKLMEEKKNLLGRLNQAEEQLKAEKRRNSQHHKLDDYELSLISQLFHADNSKVEWSSIGGLDDIVTSIKQNLNNLKNPVQQLPKGILLYGPPGCGKTMLAAAIAKETDTLFLNAHVLNIYDKEMGELQKMLEVLFSLAKKIQPVIIFIDEIDLFLGKRSSRDPKVTMVKNLFLTLWDGTDFKANNDRIMIMGATSRLKDLDEAVVRRFSLKYEVPLPDLKNREKIMKISLIKEKKQVSSEIEWKKLSENTEGWSGGDLVKLCEDAVNNVNKRTMCEKRNLTMEDFKAGFEKIQKLIMIEQSYDTGKETEKR